MGNDMIFAFSAPSLRSLRFIEFDLFYGDFLTAKVTKYIAKVAEFLLFRSNEI